MALVIVRFCAVPDDVDVVVVAAPDAVVVDGEAGRVDVAAGSRAVVVGAEAVDNFPLEHPTIVAAPAATAITSRLFLVIEITSISPRTTVRT
jgi:hypothetical protein